MLLTDRQSIRDVILFPLMRPEMNAISTRCGTCRSPGCSRSATCAAPAGMPSPASSPLVAAGGLALGVAALILVAGRDLRVPGGAARGAARPHAPDRGRAAPGLDADAAAAAREAVRKVARGGRGPAPGARAAAGSWTRARSRPSELVGFEGKVPRAFPGAAGRREGLYVAQLARGALGPRARADGRGGLAAAHADALRSAAAGSQRAGRRHLSERPDPGGAGADRPAAPGRRDAARRLGPADRGRGADLDAALEVAGRLSAVLPRGSVGAHLAGPEPSPPLRPAPGEGSDVRGRLADRAGGGAGPGRGPGPDHLEQAVGDRHPGDDGRHAGGAAPRLRDPGRAGGRLRHADRGRSSESAGPGWPTASSCCRCPGRSTSSTTCPSW